MGVAITIMGLSGIVIGSDTMANVGYSNVRYESYLKLYPFGANDEFGLFFSGSENIIGIPITTLVEECNAKLKELNLQLKHPTEAAQFLLDFYQSSIDYFQIKSDSLTDIFASYLDTVVRLEVDIDESPESEIIEVLSKLNHYELKENSNPYAVRLDLYFSKKELSKVRTNSRMKILKELNIKMSTKVYNLIFDGMATTDIFNGRITFNFAGFSENSPYPELYTLRVFGFVNNKLLYNHEVTHTSPEHPVQVTMDGEFQYIDRFISGADFNILSDFSTFYTKSLINYLAKSEQDFLSQIEYLETLIPDLNHEFQLSDVIQMFNTENDFLAFIKGLSHQEMITVTYELLRMTILLSQYNFTDYRRAGQTGGSITLASVKKHQPFKYIQRGDL